MSTITVAGCHNIEVGNTITMPVPDKRLWKRFLHFVTFRKPPMILAQHKVTEVADGTTLTIEECDELFLFENDAFYKCDGPLEEEELCDCGECDACVAARSDEHYDRKRDGEMTR